MAGLEVQEAVGTELGRVGSQAERNRKHMGGKNWTPLGRIVGLVVSLLHEWGCQGRIVRSRRSKPGRIFKITQTKFSVGQIGTLRPRVGGLLWEQSQPLLLPLLQTPMASVTMGMSLAQRVSVTPLPPPSLATGHLLLLLSLHA